MGCSSALKTMMLMFSGVILAFVAILVLFVAEVVGAAVVLAFSAVADILVAALEEWALKTLKEDYGRRKDITDMWDAMMTELQCCGLYGYFDFYNSFFSFNNNYNFPAFCCKDGKECDESKDQRKQGCLHELQEFLKRKGKIVGGVGLGIGVLELAAMVVSLTLCFQMGTGL